MHDECPFKVSARSSNRFLPCSSEQNWNVIWGQSKLGVETGDIHTATISLMRLQTNSDSYCLNSCSDSGGPGWSCYIERFQQSASLGSPPRIAALTAGYRGLFSFVKIKCCCCCYTSVTLQLILPKLYTYMLGQIKDTLWFRNSICHSCQNNNKNNKNNNQYNKPVLFYFFLSFSYE